MLLAIDIGNSNIKFGVFDGDSLHSRSSIPTKGDATAVELRDAVGQNLDFTVSRALVCSVVPDIEASIVSFIENHLGIEPVFVRNDFDFGLAINYEPLESIGTDRLVNAFSASEKYGAPCIICSLGTATTIDVVSQASVLVGGIIAPGLATMSRALNLGTARLPEIEIRMPENLLGNTTASSMQSGIVYGHAVMIDGLIGKIKDGWTDEPKVIATGGWATLIGAQMQQFDTIDDNLTLDGLRLLGRRQKSRT